MVEPVFTPVNLITGFLGSGKTTLLQRLLADPALADTAVLINEFLLLGAVLFSIGVYGVLARRNAVLVLMSIEVILNSVNINLLAFALQRSGEEAAAGSAFALFIIAVAAAEVGVGLAVVLLIYRNRRSIALDELSEMKG